MSLESRYEQFQRGIDVIGMDAFLRLRKARIAVFGLGGVGSACAEALVRSGVGSIAIIDFDHVSVTNLNRQLIALHSTLGKEKTAVLKERLKDIAPDTEVIEYPFFYDENTQGQIDLNQFDIILDCIDTISSKVLLAKKAQEAGVKIISCMGMGNRLDPGQLVFADIYKTSVCPLAKRMRKACREAGLEGFLTLYSKEEPLKVVSDDAAGRHAPGSVAFMPPVAGMMMAGEAVRQLIKDRQERLKTPAEEPT
ncbi:MAG: tRNA threonylcarbamoyladenosine dehydratase [Bacillota bacterium]|nr:tRNA threonylcarbamoyladenosine dehydratase [Bacillota bacterium]